jgi:ferric-dicitrate binding protein FerR (iron transport regulator)
MSMHPTSSRASYTRAVGLFGVCAGFCVSAPALAAGPIGSAASINQSVTGALGGRPSLVSVGDQVRLHETVRTDASGQARLVLVDDTEVAVLSGSTMTVERYAPGSKVVSAPDGTFQIHTGNGSPGELHFNTSAGTLTPQGTRFWFDVRGGHIRLDVQEGAVRFCPRGKGPAYCVVSTPGHDVIGAAPARQRKSWAWSDRLRVRRHTLHRSIMATITVIPIPLVRMAAGRSGMRATHVREALPAAGKTTAGTTGVGNPAA